ncbi:PadR family transcriptional regulator [Nocardiopsis sp. NRRL B-16309]|uniref:PadR family transcriptional regulator n=1 Tax=Nocardiopsis sp. NRRL B-16309 TaxID=1519494 RepID=UPI0006AFEC56|nr:PadR family transcriptional regulator [Nocardiopsis sp. NRRL B-16309]KOX22192.1 PadR family transcriptional regulator [Nocardiopsis sp. NRRL B-16309]
MSTIFGHGRLRLYLLKLLDESPRHGYEIISLLRDRFLGVYSPSPGTIYPRLARLEEEGLVTHTEEGGRKVYSLTDKGRAELRERSGDLDDLEREITDSVRDIARAVKQDVRATISSLREELKFAAGGVRRPASGPESTDQEPGTDRAQEEKASADAADASGSGKAGEAGEEKSQRGKDGDRDRCGPEGSPWAREWERFAQGFGAFGAVWGRGDSERQGAPEFDQALRDFSERVRDVTREAGHVGEAAARDLRRILDDTIEVIRKDMRHWGPPREDPKGDSGAAPGEAPSGTGTPEPKTESRPAPEAPAPEAEPKADAPSDSATDGQGTEEPRATPMPPSGGDPWSAAVDDPSRPGEDKNDRNDS